MASPMKKSMGPSVAKAGINLLKKFVYDNYEAPPSDKRDSERESVVGEVNVTIMGESGQPNEQTRAFVRDTSRSGCGLWSRVAMAAGRAVMVSGVAGGKTMSERIGKVRHCRGSAGTGFVIGIRFNSPEGERAKKV